MAERENMKYAIISRLRLSSLSFCDMPVETVAPTADMLIVPPISRMEFGRSFWGVHEDG